MVNGDIECGPNAVFSFKREGYNKTDFSFSDTIDALILHRNLATFFQECFLWNK